MGTHAMLVVQYTVGRGRRKTRTSSGRGCVSLPAHTSLELEREGLDPYATSTAWLQVPEEPNARLFNKPDEPNSIGSFRR